MLQRITPILTNRRSIATIGAKQQSRHSTRQILGIRYRLRISIVLQNANYQLEEFE